LDLKQNYSFIAFSVVFKNIMYWHISFEHLYKLGIMARQRHLIFTLGQDS